VGEGERKEGGEKIIQSSPSGGDADNTSRSGRSATPTRLA